MNTMKSRYKGKTQRTSGWESQPEYDSILSDLDVSSLVFLKDKLYPERLREFRNTHDLNNPLSQKEYKYMQQRIVMIREELSNRMYDINASPSVRDLGEYFDPETGIVLDENGNKLYGISFSEDEDDYIYDHTNNSTSHPTLENNKDDDETDYDNYKYHTRKGTYENWNYQDELDD